jgi:hypothetical protein
LNGTLQVSLVSLPNPFMPAAGASFDILDWSGSLDGSFSTVQLPPTLAAGLMWNASQLYTAGILRVVLAGDYNGNGVVDAADYVVWRENVGASIFGSPGVGSSLVAAVPEPGSLMLGVLVFSALLCARSPRREKCHSGR